VPATWALNATAAIAWPDRPIRSLTKNSRMNHRLLSSNVPMRKKKYTTVTVARGNRMRYAPVTAATAPLAPMTTPCPCDSATNPTPPNTQPAR
jgi:hypothetical protein